MLEKEEVWQDYNVWGLGPRMISQKEFFEEMSRPASRFTQPLSFTEKLKFSLQKFFAHHSITKDLPLCVQSGVPLNWQLILNYLYREGILESTTPIVGRFRNDKPKIEYLGLKPHYDSSVTDAPERTFMGHGSAPTFDETMSKAVGELLERYMGTYYKKDSFLKASTKEMIASGRTFLHPEKCSQFAGWQKEKFPDFQFTENSSFRWAETRHVTSGQKVYIPAQLTFWLYNWRSEKEPLLSPMTSNGMAGGFTRTEAMLGAIREYIERDSFLVYWMNTLSPEVIDLDTCADTEIQDLRKYLKRYNITPYFLNTTTDIQVPATACMLVYDEMGEPLMSVGAAAGKNAKDSLLGAYSEAVMAQSVAVGKKETIPSLFEDYEPFVRSDIDIDIRTYLWQGREMYEKAKFFLSGEKISFRTFAARFPQYTSAEDELSDLSSRISALGEGYEIYVSDKQHPILEVLGYHVVKVFIPKMVPMYLNENLAPLAATRLAEVVPKLNRGPSVLNIYPHPFP